MRSILILVIMMCVSVPVKADDLREMIALNAIAKASDLYTTLQLGGQTYETNPLIGREPDQAKTIAIFTGAVISQSIIAWMLPDEDLRYDIGVGDFVINPRRAFMRCNTGLSMSLAMHNNTLPGIEYPIDSAEIYVEFFRIEF